MVITWGWDKSSIYRWYHNFKLSLNTQPAYNPTSSEIMTFTGIKWLGAKDFFALRCTGFTCGSTVIGSELDFPAMVSLCVVQVQRQCLYCWDLGLQLSILKVFYTCYLTWSQSSMHEGWIIRISISEMMSWLHLKNGFSFLSPGAATFPSFPVNYLREQLPNNRWHILVYVYLIDELIYFSVQGIQF